MSPKYLGGCLKSGCYDEVTEATDPYCPAHVPAGNQRPAFLGGCLSPGCDNEPEGWQEFCADHQREQRLFDQAGDRQEGGEG
jgi:hypothetical protein